MPLGRTFWAYWSAAALGAVVPADRTTGGGIRDGPAWLRHQPVLRALVLLQHRLLGADGLDDRVRAEPAGEVLDRPDAVVAALGDDVGGAELAGQPLP